MSIPISETSSTSGSQTVSVVSSSSTTLMTFVMNTLKSHMKTFILVFVVLLIVQYTPPHLILDKLPSMFAGLGDQFTVSIVYLLLFVILDVFVSYVSAK